jgi:hypothetical protein
MIEVKCFEARLIQLYDQSSVIGDDQVLI